MPSDYLHNHKDFYNLLRIIEDETGIEAGLIEKNYWIMQALYGLKKQDFQFELKGGTSLSKGIISLTVFRKILIFISSLQRK